MRSFTIKLLLFITPILLLLLGVEYFVRHTENSFITKANYFNTHKENVEVLVLGTSHSQGGINPKFFKRSTCNLAYSSQNIQIDSALFFHTINDMKKLKKVIYELDYHRMDIKLDDNYYKLPWYYMYYGIEIKPIKFINRFSLYSSNTNFFNNILLEKMDKNYKPLVINQYGFVEHNYSDEFKSMHYDSLKIATTAPQRLKSRHKELSDVVFLQNCKRVEAIIQYCNSHHIDFYLISSPLYKTYCDAKIKSKDIKVKKYIAFLKSKYNIKYYDFEKNPKFTLNYFSNDDHINAKGAAIYSKLLDSIIN